VKEAYTFEQLLGMEGNVSNMMFKAFEKRLKGETGFKGSFKRSYNPPLDEINGLLSFLYTLYYSYLLPQLVVEGFDPYVGFLHRRRGRHAILVSDVMEEARPYLTFLAIPIYKEIYPEGFSSKLYLTPEGRKVALRHFEQFLEQFEPRAVKELKKMLLKKREWKSERVEQDEYASFCHRTKII
jgi:CRISPR-associated protein Cas1